MKKLFIVANWKSNKTSEEIKDWFKTFGSYEPQAEKEIIICPSFIYLQLVHSLIMEYKLPFKAGAQDVSSFSQGAYTGEVNGAQIKEYAEYAIIGHSERRDKLGEKDDLLEEKVKHALEQNVEPIFCVQSGETQIPDGVKIIAYEPPNSISTSGPDAQPDDPGEASKIVEQIKSKVNNITVIYGGSVDSNNVHSFTEIENIDGVLVGGASLDPSKFLEIIKNA